MKLSGINDALAYITNISGDPCTLNFPLSQTQQELLPGQSAAAHDSYFEVKGHEYKAGEVTPFQIEYVNQAAAFRYAADLGGQHSGWQNAAPFFKTVITAQYVSFQLADDAAAPIINSDTAPELIRRVAFSEQYVDVDKTAVAPVLDTPFYNQPINHLSAPVETMQSEIANRAAIDRIVNGTSAPTENKTISGKAILSLLGLLSLFK